MKALLLLLHTFMFCYSLSAQLTLIVTAVPPNTPLSDSIFVAGNFNSWDAGALDYQLIKAPSGDLQITISPNPGELKFKFTRGDWSRVEGDANGNFRPDRILNYDGNPITLELQILSWEGSSNGPSTAADNVSVLNDQFYIPQLDRYRKIWLYLPPDYYSSNKRYPVLYMHDGQNLFDDATSFSGEWQVDETLNTLFDQGDYGIIVVGIENGGANRIDEYLPWEHPSYGGGQGKLYVDFIIENLKPYIDQTYRTFSEQEYTGIMGSSLGGLISCYGAIEHQEVFGKAGCFSSSFWLYDLPYTHVDTTGKKEDLKMYFIAGQQEDDVIDMPEDMYRMKQTLLNNGFSPQEINAIDHKDGTHSEWYWAREFGAAYQWLFADIDVSTSPSNLEIDYQVSIYPNPGKDFLIVKKEGLTNQLELEVLNLNGQLVFTDVITSNRQKIALPSLPAGAFVIKITEQGRLIYRGKWMKN